MEPGGEDLGKLFGPRGRFSPKKAEKKEPTARARLKSGELTPNPDRPSGMEELLRRNPPEEGPKEPTALSRMKSGELNYRLMPSKSEPKKSTVKYDFENQLAGLVPIRKKGTRNPFDPHAAKLKKQLQELHDRHLMFGKLTDRDRGKYALQVVTEHFKDLKRSLRNMGDLPSSQKHGQYEFSEIHTDPAFGMAKDLVIHLKPFRTNINSHQEIKDLTDHLEKTTGHIFYIGNHKQYMVGTSENPLVLKTTIFHPDIMDEDDDHRRDGGGDDDPEPIVPKSPRGKKPQLT